MKVFDVLLLRLKKLLIFFLFSRFLYMVVNLLLKTLIFVVNKKLSWFDMNVNVTNYIIRSQAHSIHLQMPSFQFSALCAIFLHVLLNRLHADFFKLLIICWQNINISSLSKVQMLTSVSNTYTLIFLFLHKLPFLFMCRFIRLFHLIL